MITPQLPHSKEPLASQFWAECLDCGNLIGDPVAIAACPRCGGQWMEARYPYEALAETFLQRLAEQPFDLWRYRQLLPVRSPARHLSMGEGGTPLLHAENLGRLLGLPHIYIKDERQGPTSSLKDRQAAVCIAALKESGIAEMVLASTGNSALAYSAYAARAGIRLWAFLTSLTPPEKMREAALYGTQVIKVTASYDQTKQVAAQFAQQRGLYFERGARSIPSVEAMKTLAFEISEQITALEAVGKRLQGGARRSPWRAPDWYFQAVSGGLGPLGVQKGFDELFRMGLIDRLPAIACIQAEGCAPMARAWKQGRAQAEPVLSPRTHIATLATGDPGRAYTLLYWRMQASDGRPQKGAFECVSDEETFHSMHVLAKMEGISAEPAAAVAFAGLIRLARNGQIDPEEVVVVNCSGHTIAVGGDLTGEGWVDDVVLPGQASEDTPEEGLLAALTRLEALQFRRQFPRIAIVDDHPEARRLIRRILQAQGDYLLFEAADGRQAIELSRQEDLDLMILDLLMPEVDGFAVLDALTSNPRTASMPVIVVTAKDLTLQEKARLKGRIHSLMLKGELLGEELVEEVHSSLASPS